MIKIPTKIIKSENDLYLRFKKRNIKIGKTEQISPRKHIISLNYNELFERWRIDDGHSIHANYLMNEISDKILKKKIQDTDILNEIYYWFNFKLGYTFPHVFELQNKIINKKIKIKKKKSNKKNKIKKMLKKSK